MEFLGVLQFCQCKSTCQRAHRCPCKGKGSFCTARCKCKAKSGPCKNKPEGDAGPSRVQETLRANREEVKVRIISVDYSVCAVILYGYRQALVQSLDGNQKEALLIELLQDRGGVELARCMMQRSDNDDNYQPPQGTPAWCKCGK